LVASCSDDPLVPIPDVLDALSIASYSVVADSLATIPVVATITRGTTPGDDPVTFVTTKGRFAGADAEDTSIVKAMPDKAGKATVLLRLSGDPGLATIAARFRADIVLDTLRFSPRPPGLSTLQPSIRSAPADGESLFLVSATVPREARPPNRMVTFATSAGAILANGRSSAIDSALADASGRAIVLLRASRSIGIATVSASAGGSALHDTVRFVRAFPELLSAASSPTTIDSGAVGSAITIRVQLLRSVGTVTAGASAVFTATKVGGASIGAIDSLSLSDTSGVITARFTTLDSSYVGPITITARTDDEFGVHLEAQTAVTVVRPKKMGDPGG
jgi:hypothetical protein